MTRRATKLASSGERLNAGKRVSEALARVEALYTGNLATHGIDSKAVGWPDRESQLLRFEKLAYLIDIDSPTEPVTVNDLGCGYGAMFKFLDERPGLELERWFGYDISRDMLEAARRHVDDPRAELIEGADITRDADYTFVSGTFNVRVGATDEAWSAYVKDVLRTIARHSRRGFAFNLLTCYVDWRKADLFYADPAEFFTFCREDLARHVALLHDYPLFEWTIVALHEGRPR
jgi:SAM-dependent methyltransferase